MNLVLHRRPGAKPKLVVRERLLVLLEELGVATPQRLRARYRERFGEPVGWNTISRHLRALVEAGSVREHTVTAGKRRNTVLYEIPRIAPLEQ